MIPSPKAISLYIHLPWCIHKCPYCDFNSHEASANKIRLIEDVYIDSIIKEFNFYKDILHKRKIISIFFGGGTPSLISARLYEKILNRIHKNYDLSSTELTLEANPGTIDKDNFQAYRHAGINRISLGVQSFNDKHLLKLERIHSSKEAKNAIEFVKKIFDNFNLDLMFALPQQTLDELNKDLETALLFSPSHLSFYHLTIEPQTRFYKTPPSIPSEDYAFKMYEMITSKLKKNNYKHYETSAFAKDEKKSKHNLNYWLFGDYLGLGAGAHSKITMNDSIFRMNNSKNPKNYIDLIKQNNYFQNKQTITADNLPFEFMMNALRLTSGFSKKEFKQKTGIEYIVLKNKLHKSFRAGLLDEDNENLKPTKKGILFLNEILHNLI